jgi:hypothetical protein
VGVGDVTGVLAVPNGDMKRGNIHFYCTIVGLLNRKLLYYCAVQRGDGIKIISHCQNGIQYTMDIQAYE